MALSQTKPAWALLNDTAAEIARKCSGQNGCTLDELELYFPAVTQSDLLATLRSLSSVGLLRSVSAGEPPPHFERVKPTSCSPYRVEHLYVELHARCNLRCIHCYMEGAPERPERLAPQQVIELLRDFARLEGRFVTLSGGEPLLYKAFMEIAHEVRDLSLGGTVISNGLPLRERHLVALAQLDFNVAISLDGMSPETNDPIRGLGTFHRIVRAIDLAIAILGAERVVVSFTPTKRNLSDIPALFRFAAEHGVRRLNVSLLENVGRAQSFADELTMSPSDREQVVEMLFDEALRCIGEVEVDFNDTRNILEVFRPDQHPSQVHPLWKGIRIDSSGDCFPSTFGSVPDFRLGNISETSLETIIAAPELQRLYGLLVDRFENIPTCNACAWGQLCRGGGVTSAYYATGSFFAPDAYCGGYLRVFPRIARALARRGAGAP